MKTSAKILSIDKKKMKVRLGIREASTKKDPFDYFNSRENNEILTKQNIDMTLDVMSNSLIYWSQELYKNHFSRVQNLI